MKTKLVLKDELSPTLLGFGCMRFPTKKVNNERVIDFEETEKMLDYAYEKGVTYFDTAYPYHGGESEKVLGRVMKKYDRKTFLVATKLPMWKLEKQSDIREIFEEQLSKLQMDYVDYYLLHALSKERVQTIKDLNVIEEVVQLKNEGKIKHLGFSFHDDYPVFEEIINMYDWDFCQIQFNYMDVDEQAGLKGLKLAESKGIPVIVMEPIRGGSLAKFSDDVNELFTSYNKNASIASWALRYVASFENVKIILSGMSTFDQVKDNINTFTDYKEMNKEEFEVIAKAKKLIESKVKSPCTGCRYCMPCPQGVKIPKNFALWNENAMYGFGAGEWEYNQMEATNKASACIKCGKCEKLCPQHIHIREDLEKVAKVFEK